jgi:FAD dependent oxidoreductase TIGR03364
VSSEWDIIVVGAGILGTFHAYFAALRGWRVLLMERDCWPREASVRNFGTLMAGSLAGEWHRRGLESIAIYRQLAPAAGFHFQDRGSLYLVTTELEVAILEEFARLGPSQGHRCELLDPSQAAAINPLLNGDDVRMGLFFPDDARVEPRGLFQKLIPWLTRELPIEYRPTTAAVSVTADRGQACVRTAAGTEFRARHAVICNGADLRTLFPERFKAAGFERCKLHMMRIVPQQIGRMPATLASGLTLRRYPAFQMCPSWSRLENKPPAAGVLEHGIHVLMVQDADGSFVLGDSHEYTEQDFSDILNAEIEQLIISEARKLVRLANWEIGERWHGIYGLPRDAELYCQTIDGVIHIVTGIRGKGMTTSPAVARKTIESLEVTPH